MARVHRTPGILGLLALLIAATLGRSLWSGTQAAGDQLSGALTWEYATYSEVVSNQYARFTFVSGAVYETTSGEELESSSDSQSLRMALAKNLKMEYPRKTYSFSSKHQMLNLLAREGWEVYFIERPRSSSGGSSGTTIYDLRRRVGA
ncbi:MAG: hypothetical protein H8E31_08730 [Planctomycetes bacterium]|nr:hypothetical protein [Planctomycetota bacterium]